MPLKDHYTQIKDIDLWELYNNIAWLQDFIAYKQLKQEYNDFCNDYPQWRERP